MVTKTPVKKTIKKPVIKTNNQVEAKKEVLKHEINFPVIRTINVKNFDVNWFALSKTFKSKFKFIYEKKETPEKSAKKGPKYLTDKATIKIITINYRWLLDNLNDKTKKYYECYLIIFDYYVNKKNDFDLNERIKEVFTYGK
jgi:hypothetical protein